MASSEQTILPWEEEPFHVASVHWLVESALSVSAICELQDHKSQLLRNGNDSTSYAYPRGGSRGDSSCRMVTVVSLPMASAKAGSEPKNTSYVGFGSLSSGFFILRKASRQLELSQWLVVRETHSNTVPGVKVSMTFLGPITVTMINPYSASTALILVF